VCVVALGAPASPVLNGHAAALSQTATPTAALYGTSAAWLQLGSPSATFPAVRRPMHTSLFTNQTVVELDRRHQSVQSINLLKAKGPNGHLRRSKIHDMQ